MAITAISPLCVLNIESRKPNIWQERLCADCVVESQKNHELVRVENDGFLLLSNIWRQDWGGWKMAVTTQVVFFQIQSFRNSQGKKKPKKKNFIFLKDILECKIK